MAESGFPGRAVFLAASGVVAMAYLHAVEAPPWLMLVTLFLLFFGGVVFYNKIVGDTRYRAGMAIVMAFYVVIAAYTVASTVPTSKIKERLSMHKEFVERKEKYVSVRQLHWEANVEMVRLGAISVQGLGNVGNELQVWRLRSNGELVGRMREEEAALKGVLRQIKSVFGPDPDLNELVRRIETPLNEPVDTLKPEGKTADELGAWALGRLNSFDSWFEPKINELNELERYIDNVTKEYY